MNIKKNFPKLNKKNKIKKYKMQKNNNLSKKTIKQIK